MTDAAQRLESLATLEGQAVDTQAALDRIRATREPVDAPASAPDAGFALPESLATAIVGGALLGPVGGVLLGVAQGILTKNERQGVLDQLYSEQNALTETQSILGDEVERHAALAESPEDREFLGGLQARLESAGKYARSGSPRFNERAAAMYDEIGAELSRFTERQEDQRIQFEEQRRADQIAYGNEMVDRNDKLLGEFTQRSSVFDERMQGIATIKQAINSGDSAAALQVFSQMPLLINPAAGNVTDSELEMWQGVGNSYDKVRSMIDKFTGTGGGWTDDTRKEMLDLVGRIEDATYQSQLTIEKEFADRILDNELPIKFWNNYNRTGNMPQFRESEFQKTQLVDRETAQTIRQGAADAVPDPVQSFYQDVVGNTTDAIENTVNWIKGRGPGQRGMKP